MYWFFSIFIGFLFILGGMLAGFSYWKQKTNGLNIAIVLVAVEIGFMSIGSTLIAMGFGQIYWAGVAGQLHMMLTLTYFVWRLFSDSSNSEVSRTSKKHNQISRTDAAGNSL